MQQLKHSSNELLTATICEVWTKQLEAVLSQGACPLWTVTIFQMLTPDESRINSHLLRHKSSFGEKTLNVANSTFTAQIFIFHVHFQKRFQCVLPYLPPPLPHSD